MRERERDRAKGAALTWTRTYLISDRISSGTNSTAFLTVVVVVIVVAFFVAVVVVVVVVVHASATLAPPGVLPRFFLAAFGLFLLAIWQHSRPECLRLVCPAEIVATYVHLPPANCQCERWREWERERQRRREIDREREQLRERARTRDGHTHTHARTYIGHFTLCDTLKCFVVLLLLLLPSQLPHT